MSANTPGQISADGAYYWNGQQWITTMSPDGAHRWNGSIWEPLAPAAPPQPPSGPPTQPAPHWLPMDAPGAAPTALAPAASPSAMAPAVPLPPGAIAPGIPGVPSVPMPPRYGGAAAANRGNLGYQFGGTAAWSIGLGLASIIAPFTVHFYFPVLPLFGLWRAYLALRYGRTAGAVVGFAVNILGGFVSLLASGLLNLPNS